MATFSTACIILIMAGTSFPNPTDGTPTTCSRGSDLEQTTPIFPLCSKQINRHGHLVETIPMVIPMSSYMNTKCGRRNMFGKQWGHILCRFKAPTSNTPPTPDKQYSTTREPLVSTDESTTNKITSTTAYSTAVWPAVTMSTIPGSTTAETTPTATQLQGTYTLQTTLLDTTMLIPSTEIASTKADLNTIMKSIFSTTKQLTSSPSVTTKTQTMSATTQIPMTIVTTQTPTTSVTTRTPTTLVTTPTPRNVSTEKPTNVTTQTPSTTVTSPTPLTIVTTPTTTTKIHTPTPTTKVITLTPSSTITTPTPTVTIQTPRNVTTEPLATTITTPTPTTTFTTPTPTTKVTTQTPTTTFTTPTPTTKVITQTPTTTIPTPTSTTKVKTPSPSAAITTPTPTVTIQTPRNVTTETPTTTITTPTPTTKVITPSPSALITTQTPTTSVTTQTPTTESDFTHIPMNCTSSADNCKVFVTNQGEHRILWADLYGSNKLQFSVFLDLEGKKPSDVNFDPVEQKVYWSDNDNKRIWRASLESQQWEAVTHENSADKPLGIVIAVQARYLYCTYESKGWIHRVMLGDPDSETCFVGGLNKPKALAIDEQQGYLYWSRHEGIDRKRLNGVGGTHEVLPMASFSKMFGLMIDTAGTRLFFCDENSKEALYLDIGSSSPVKLISANEGYVLRDVSMDGNGVLYWLQSGDKRILVMDDYESSPEFHIEAEHEFGNPQRIHIARITHGF